MSGAEAMTRDADVEVRDPRTGRVERHLHPPSPAELAATCARLRAAQPGWEAAGAAGRVAALRDWRSALADGRDQLVASLVHDTGRLVESQLEVDLVLAGLDRWCRLAPELLDTSASMPTALPAVTVLAGLRPYPLVGVISPWNFPLLLGLIDVLPALAAGCAVVVKPSEVTPRFIAPLRRTIAAVPAVRDVLAVVEGAAQTGAALVGSVDAVSFTGSVPTGRAVAEAAARAFVPAFLELGGKDPAVVLPGADLDRASSAVLWGGTANAGQSCLSIERVYVAEGDAVPFVELLVAKARQVGLAWPTPADGQLGPIIDPAQVAVIERHLHDAVAKGARVRCGGTVERLGGGCYLRPTVLTGVDHSMLVMREETFGPVLPVMAYPDVEAAVQLANDTAYGLSAAVFGATEDAALGVARRLQAGAVSVNDAALTAVVQDGEKTSFGLSGLGGSRMGPAGLRRFLRRQALLVNRGEGPDPWWYDAAGPPAAQAGPTAPAARPADRQEAADGGP